MKKILFIIAAAFALTACSPGSMLIRKDGTKEEISDFKASADANAVMYGAQADVMYKAQEVNQACFNNANTDIQFALCSLKAQSTDFAQATGGKPSTNRNPRTSVEQIGAVGGKAVDAAKTGVVAVAAAKAVTAAVDAQASVQTTVVEQPAPVVVTQPAPVIVPLGSVVAPTE